MKKGKATKLNDLMDIYDVEYKSRMSRYKSCMLGSYSSLLFDLKHDKIPRLSTFTDEPRGKAYRKIAEIEAWK